MAGRYSIKIGNTVTYNRKRYAVVDVCTSCGFVWLKDGIGSGKLMTKTKNVKKVK